ncbi:MAG: DNA-directed RNA polymerase subunit beta [Candidatus Collierbacteria bacterium GW2011_GWA1_42_60]|uniref:DNA-directed RNA polymerase subunit beta n=1 Tax=Candidatus Collierbacteria bacterium GW2011_GWA2_42_17 TaxID=1618378 RepID=A0A0G0Z3M5_9BACT|nr:MAG: DNA-directed RNA polymerase subunit beta [Candidatus Collierbacteria bacterium GW2011_GWA2_42_17]KKS67059.1 MAG: DNA-directed RNA polymerase subunit beta [Candidatus Collierbacteria bacterium GW2011_GWA1_42_60]HAI22618.1 DNA-directed RNA polymerase subunit beta [Candidatus Collierbacteria bacterium]HBX64442.1 DNA-directed RNA polymerase subunit beta [Candidatus Collierbacteria bacterium]
MNKQTNRENWGTINPVLPELNLIQIQINSYKQFLQDGISESLTELNPIKDFTGKVFEFEFLSNRIGLPKITPKQAIEKGVTFEAPLWATVKLTNLHSKATQQQEIFLGDIPMMTSTGTFIINGVERVVVDQLVRSPGAYFTREVDPHSGRAIHQAEIRPMRGSWLEVIVSRNDHLSVRIDRHRKVSATTLLRALGFSTNEEILALFSEVDIDKDHPYIATTLLKDPTTNTEEALLEFYQKVRPGEPAVLDNAKALLHQMFFDSRRYNLGLVGRYKMSRKLGLSIPVDKQHVTLSIDDFVGSIKYLIDLQNGKGKVDDIDHLANRRLRCVGELVNQTSFKAGLLRLERSIKEKMSLAKPDELPTPAAFVNPRPIISAITEFFRRNRLSSILDQVNPLSEIDNLRRISVMGPGGITRERASFSMRDIHSSQYSRICPVRSPEGPNIGLVTYLALYTRINDYGFLESPYLKVEKVTRGGKTKMVIGKEIIFLAADDEEDVYVTHAGIERDGDVITQKWVPARYQGKYLEVDVDLIQYIDVVPRQVVGTSASLIPFIQQDEGTRALMGTHHLTQALPLVKPSAPIVGTGMESVVAQSMGWSVTSQFAGEVISVDADHISLKLSPSDAKIAASEISPFDYGFVEVNRDIVTYNIRKYHNSSQDTSYNQHPLVDIGDKIKKGDCIINGPAAENGELALGQNLLIAYAAFEGLGYEDAIVVSDRCVSQDLLSSVHIHEHTCDVMDTKLGPEELTRDIPNVAETDLRNLDHEGIIAVGSVVGPNDILIGKIAPKGETELTAEERLLRAIFGEKAREVRDTSLRMPHGEQGVIISIRILNRDDGDELDAGVIKQIKVKVAQLRKITVGDKVAGRHGNKGVISKIVSQADMPHMADGTPVDIIISPLSVLARMNLGQLLEAQLGFAGSKLGKRYSVPVFESVSEAKIAAALKEANLPVTGKIQLYDGRSGEAFEEETAVGVTYIIKLNHMVEDKTHARSIGPYSLVTQQPLGGKAQMGGQRLGEMEVWALEAHKAAYTLQEMLTIKSDDVVGRSKAFESIVKGETISMSSVPESFKVLMKELNSLGLAIVPTGSVEVVEEEAVSIKPEVAAEITEATAMSEELQAATFEDEEESEETEEVSEEAAEAGVTNEEVNQ